jgi:hypothetical protein
LFRCGAPKSRRLVEDDSLMQCGWDTLATVVVKRDWFSRRGDCCGL